MISRYPWRGGSFGPVVIFFSKPSPPLHSLRISFDFFSSPGVPVTRPTAVGVNSKAHDESRFSSSQFECAQGSMVRGSIGQAPCARIPLYPQIGT
jgi:hypothetical protein